MKTRSLHRHCLQNELTLITYKRKLNQIGVHKYYKFQCLLPIPNKKLHFTTGYVYERFNTADWYSVTTYPYLAIIKNPWFYANEKRKKDYKKLMEGQRFMRERVLALGPDLAAAYFLLGRGCRVRFKHQKGMFQSKYSAISI